MAQWFQHIQCRRCGTCCRKGGPALHLADRALVEDGVIPLAQLYTLRKGELAWENIRGGVVPLDDEIIKIKEVKGGRACVFFHEAENGCAIYDRRPLECRALKCWDTRKIEAVYAKDRLSRKDLLEEKVPWLWDLVQTHEGQCSWDHVRRLETGDNADPKALAEIRAYDREMRRLVTERSGVDAEMLAFVFGWDIASNQGQENIHRFRNTPRGSSGTGEVCMLSCEHG